MARLHNDDVRMGEESVESQLAAPVSQVTFSRITDDDDAMPSSGQTVVPVIPVYTDGTYTTAVIDSWTDNGGQNVGTPGDINTNSDISVTIPTQYVDVEETITYIDVVIVDDFTPETLQELQTDGWTFYAIYSDYTEDEVDYTEVFDPSTTVSQEVVDQAYAVANAINQNFWTDTNGVHVTEDEKDDWLEAAALNFSDQSDTSEHSNVLINSLGTLFRRRLNNLVSIARNAISFYTGEGNTTSDILAYFGTSGSQIGPSNDAHLSLTPLKLELTNSRNVSLFRLTNLAESDGYRYSTKMGPLYNAAITQVYGLFNGQSYDPTSTDTYVFYVGDLVPPYKTEVDTRQGIYTYIGDNLSEVPWEIVKVELLYDKRSTTNATTGTKYHKLYDITSIAESLGMFWASFGVYRKFINDSTVIDYRNYRFPVNGGILDVLYDLGLINSPDYQSYVDARTAFGSNLAAIRITFRDDSPASSVGIGLTQFGTASGVGSIASINGRAVGQSTLALQGIADKDSAIAVGYSAYASYGSIALDGGAFLPSRDTSYWYSNIRGEFLVNAHSTSEGPQARYGSISVGGYQAEASLYSMTIGSGYVDLYDRRIPHQALYHSAAIGIGCYAYKTSLAVGIGTIAEDQAVAIGQYNSTYDTVADTRNAFVVGNGIHRDPVHGYKNSSEYYNGRSNGFTVKRDGSVVNNNFIASVDSADNDIYSFFEVGKYFLGTGNNIKAKRILPIENSEITRVTGSDNDVITSIELSSVSSDGKLHVLCTIPGITLIAEILNTLDTLGDRGHYHTHFFDSEYDSLTSSMWIVAVFKVYTSSGNSWTVDTYLFDQSNTAYSTTTNYTTVTSSGNTVEFKVSSPTINFTNTVDTDPGMQYSIDFYYLPGEEFISTPLRFDPQYAVFNANTHLTFGTRPSKNNIGNFSTTLGTSLIASGENQLVIGKYNVADSKAAFIIGNGASDSSRSNVFEQYFNVLRLYTPIYMMDSRDIDFYPSSSNDTGDIVWYYYNNNEKARIWFENAYDTIQGPNYRVYKSDGTQLTSTRLALENKVLPLSGGTIDGDLHVHGYFNTLIQGYSHSATGTSGTNGYVAFLEIKVKAAYVNAPIEIVFINRGQALVSHVWFTFANSSGVDPGINYIRTIAGMYSKVYMYKVSTSTWRLVVQKTEAWDNVYLMNIITCYGLSQIEFSKINVFLSSLPSSYSTVSAI